MKYRIIETSFDEFYRGEELVTLKKEIVVNEEGLKKEIISERVEKEMLACGCSGVNEKVLTIVQPFKIIKESSID